MAPRLAPSKPPTKITPIVCPVMGIGLKGTGMDICANKAINNDPSRTANILAVLSSMTRTPELSKEIVFVFIR